MKKFEKKIVLLEIVYAALLVIPIVGILSNYNYSLADIELGDPVKLTFSYPDFMKLFKWAMITAIVCSILPMTRKFFGILLGFGLGGLLFLYQSTMADLKSLSEMGLSKKPMEEMITLTKHGENFTFWCVASVVCFVIVMLAECVMPWIIKKVDKSETSATLD
ncbi:MAG: hypothetical protein ACSHX6_16055 [Akkermansiaceae bacterium]